MLSRREFLIRTLQGSSLIALGSTVPRFLADTAWAAEPGKDKVLVVLEMNGGNDGLNTIVPYADDEYYKARPTIGLKKEQCIRIDDHIGLNPAMRGIEKLLNDSQLAVVQGVGYPNPDRSHFESMDIWQSADPRRQTGSGWLARALGSLKVQDGQIPGIHVSTEKLPLALYGSGAAVPSIHPNRPYELELDLNSRRLAAFRQDRFGIEPPQAVEPPRPANPDSEKHRAARMKLIQEVTEKSNAAANSMQQFVQRSSLQTYTTIERLRDLMRDGGNVGGVPQEFRDGQVFRNELMVQLNLIARIIQAGFGTRVFYCYISGFDTHARQKDDHERLLRQVADGIGNFYRQLEGSGDAKRVVLMTFSEFGRRVHENGSKGTDHGAASCMFVAGPGVKSGPVGKHPSLKKQDLDEDDLKMGIDFRQVYATLLDKWLECDSQRILGVKFPHAELIK